MLAICLPVLMHGEIVSVAESADGPALRDGDRVVFLGGTLVEREQRFGHWETLLTAAYAGQDITFRNLGWSGDTVWGESRGLFEPHLGYQRLVEQVTAANPTVVIVAYGSNESYAGEQGLEAFTNQYAKLLDDLSAKDRRFILLCPLYLEASQIPHNPDAASDFAQTQNANIDLYAEAIGSLAESGGHGIVDLREQHRQHLNGDGPPLTFNGLTFTDHGYRRTAVWLTDQLSEHVPLEFETPSVAALRDAIIKKNELFFHRWRPQNFTYLFGFRQHEQGNNAVEIPQFDPLVEQAEQEIAKLAVMATKD